LRDSSRKTPNEVGVFIVDLSSLYRVAVFRVTKWFGYKSYVLPGMPCSPMKTSPPKTLWNLSFGNTKSYDLFERKSRVGKITLSANLSYLNGHKIREDFRTHCAISAEREHS
jgi:hypothetical protein